VVARHVAAGQAQRDVTARDQALAEGLRQLVGLFLPAVAREQVDPQTRELAARLSLRVRERDDPDGLG